jgi:hypothetical protein
MHKVMMVGLLVAGGLFVGVVGCDKKDGDGKAGAAGDSIGVTECDDYFKKMDSCMAKMPAESKAATEAAMKQNRDAWKQAASTSAGKDGLKTACKAALDAMASNPACK